MRSEEEQTQAQITQSKIQLAAQSQSSLTATVVPKIYRAPLPKKRGFSYRAPLPVICRKIAGNSPEKYRQNAIMSFFWKK